MQVICLWGDFRQTSFILCEMYNQWPVWRVNKSAEKVASSFGKTICDKYYRNIIFFIFVV